MENDKLNLILSQLEKMSASIDCMRDDMREMRSDIVDLQEGQKSIRRDLARVERKIDRLSNDVGDTLAIVTEATDRELTALRKAK